jgi:hypothetical protein
MDEEMRQYKEFTPNVHSPVTQYTKRNNHITIRKRTIITHHKKIHGTKWKCIERERNILSEIFIPCLCFI